MYHPVPTDLQKLPTEYPIMEQFLAPRNANTPLVQRSLSRPGILPFWATVVWYMILVLPGRFAMNLFTGMVQEWICLLYCILGVNSKFGH